MRGKVALSFFILLIALNILTDGHALTFEQIVALRKAGVGDATIRIMLEQEREAKVSSENGMGQKEIRDSHGNSAIVYSTGRSNKSDYDEQETKKVEKAWEMLQHLIIDRRGVNEN
jgi:hypothetical protein